MTVEDGVAGEDALAQLRVMERAIVASVGDNPLEATCLVVGAGAALFYWAEAGCNDKVNDYWDAVHYISTCLSVGYANIFPVTPVGKIVGALVMMIGPSLSSRVLDDGKAAAADPALLSRLDDVLAELRRIGGKA